MHPPNIFSDVLSKALADSRQPRPRRNDYLGTGGTISLLAALDVKTGKVLGHVRRRHCAVEFRQFLDVLDAHVPPDLDVHIIMDNYGTHKSALIRRWFTKRPRCHVHFTPTYATVAQPD